MEVLYHPSQSLPLFRGSLLPSAQHHQHHPLSTAAAAASMVFPVNNTHLGSHQLSVPPGAGGSSPVPFTCYSFQTTPSPYTPSRTPTPEFPQARSASRESSASSSAASGSLAQESNLKSVLRGEVPKEYAHLMMQSSSSSSPSPSPSSSYISHHRHHHHRHHHNQRSSPLDGRLGTGVLSSSLPVSSTPVLSPPPEDVQTEPMDLSCKRPRTSSTSAVRLSGSCPPSFSSSSSSSSSSSPSPALLSTAFHHALPPSPCEEGHGHQGQDGEFSLLRNLLEVGHGHANYHHHQQIHHPPSSMPFPPPFCHHSNSHSSSSSPARLCDSPSSSRMGTPPALELSLNGSTQVTLTEDNRYSISARVSDWLMRMVHFASGIPCFQDLDHEDRSLLLLSSWSRLLLLFMAESNFQFEVAPVMAEPLPPPEMDVSKGGGGMPPPDQPTMKSVEGIRSFIGKCQKMEVEMEEYAYLRMLVLFNGSHLGIREASRVEDISQKVTAMLREHVQRTHPADLIRYSRLLLTLPALYGISDKMVNQLFCQHMDSDSDTNVEELLKTLLRTLSPEGRSR